jgi:hypothetical protein
MPLNNTIIIKDNYRYNAVLKIFESIFKTHSTDSGRYPEDIVQMAIERAIDGTDHRLRGLSGYQHKLRPAVLRAIDHVVALVASLPKPVELSAKNYSEDPRLTAAFSSPGRIMEVLQLDQSLTELLTERNVSGLIYTVMMMEKQEKNVFGVDLEGGALHREVAQVSVSFMNHRFLDPSSSLEENQRLLRRRAFDHLLTIALRRIASQHEKRVELERTRDLLRRKLKVLESGQWGFDACKPQEFVDPKVMDEQLQNIEKRLSEFAPDTGKLAANLDTLIDVMNTADQQMWIQHKIAYVDRKSIKRDKPDPSTLTLELEEIGGSLGRTAILLPVVIPREEIPAPKNFLTEAARYL